jgi:hypothetical protein
MSLVAQVLPPGEGCLRECLFVWLSARQLFVQGLKEMKELKKNRFGCACAARPVLFLKGGLGRASLFLMLMDGLAGLRRPRRPKKAASAALPKAASFLIREEGLALYGFLIK